MAGRWRDLFSDETVTLRAGQPLAVPGPRLTGIGAEPAAG